MITIAGIVGWSCVLDSWKLSTEDEVLKFDGENCPNPISRFLWPLLMEMDVDGLEDCSVNKVLESCFSPLVLKTVIAMPPLLFT